MILCLGEEELKIIEFWCAPLEAWWSLLLSCKALEKEQVWRGGEIMKLILDVVISNACHVGDWICYFKVQKRNLEI